MRTKRSLPRRCLSKCRPEFSQATVIQPRKVTTAKLNLPKGNSEHRQKQLDSRVACTKVSTISGDASLRVEEDDGNQGLSASSWRRGIRSGHLSANTACGPDRAPEKEIRHVHPGSARLNSCRVGPRGRFRLCSDRCPGQHRWCIGRSL